MPTRRLSILALVSIPAVCAVVACGSSSGPGESPDGGAADDSGASPDVSLGNEGDGSSGGDAGPSGNDATTTDSATAADSGTSATDSGILGANCPAFDAGAFVEGTHAPLPTVAYYGGPTLTAPQVITFTFSTTPSATQLQAFGQTITSTPWFATVTKDYCIPDGGPCIQAGPPGIAVNMTVAAASDYSDTFGSDAGTGGGTDLDQFMVQQISAAVTAGTIPAPGANSLYAFYFPPSSNVWAGPVGQGGESCSSFGGYHSSMYYTDGVTPITYAILPDCQYPGSTPADDFLGVTIAASHEIVEATTDPGSNGTLAFYLDQPFAPDAGVTDNEYRNDPWATALSYGEVGDNCESIPADTWLLDGGDTVQRIWSTSAAALGHNPCVPVPSGETYYNASSDKAIYVANVGDTFTVDVSAFADGPRVSWRLDAIDGTPSQLASQTNPNPYLQMSWVNGVTDGDGGTPSLLCVNNGTTGKLTVKLLADPTTDTSLQQEEWPEADGIIYSADVANTVNVPLPGDAGSYPSFPYQFWPFAVITPATAAQLGIPSTGISDPRQVAALRAAHRRPGTHVTPPRLPPFARHVMR